MATSSKTITLKTNEWVALQVLLSAGFYHEGKRIFFSHAGRLFEFPDVRSDEVLRWLAKGTDEKAGLEADIEVLRNLLGLIGLEKRSARVGVIADTQKKSPRLFVLNDSVSLDKKTRTTLESLRKRLGLPTVFSEF